MKVYITQGHEQGIGLEVLFKACLLSSKRDLEVLTLLAYQAAVESTLKSMKIPYTIGPDWVEVAGQRINAEWLTRTDFSQSFTSLELGMKLAEAGGVLFTLPTSKDQFPDCVGHTEYFRRFYKKPELGMFFSSPKHQVLLLSDHIPISAISESLTAELIEARLKQAIKTLQEWKWPIERILIAGFNPHAGEGGLIGHEDDRVKQCIERLSESFQIGMSGPLPGDTMILEQRSPRDLLVYIYHDQGLGVFKGLQGFIGSNITLGLPYPRVSPDHGTSFKLFGKNIADYRGCAFSLKEAILLLQRIQDDGKNYSHKGKGP
ncbi:MAG TPA: 4-hydroxythreonine-4-phosphate dehydrogenase PdxA [Bacteriovoracaceae bacterium]|nr:4-hydroxythreonine-4-phosphate dehydrogenase PdxA [Bacteriovoracaceae bacterium]